MRLQGAAKATSVQASTWDAVFNALRPSEAPLARSASMGSTPRVAATASGDGGGGGGGASTVTPHRQGGQGRPSPRAVGQLPPPSQAASARDRGQDSEVTLTAEAIGLAASQYKRRKSGSSKRGWELSVREEERDGGSLRDSGGVEDDDKKPAAGSNVTDSEEDGSGVSGTTTSSDSTGSGSEDVGT
jgi:hypothetical protein